MTDEVIEAASLGIKVEQFLKSEEGKYFLKRKDEDYKIAMDALLAIDPYEHHTLGELQSAVAKTQEDVRLAKKVSTYFGDAILNGRQAEDILNSEEEL